MSNDILKHVVVLALSFDTALQGDLRSRFSSAETSTSCLYKLDTTPDNRHDHDSHESNHDFRRTTFLNRLKELPEKRAPPWQLGKVLPPVKCTDSPRGQQRNACILETRGDVAETPCEHCERGNGRFSTCIMLYPWLQGACSTCIFTSKANRCSLRIQTLGEFTSCVYIVTMLITRQAQQSM